MGTLRKRSAVVVTGRLRGHGADLDSAWAHGDGGARDAMPAGLRGLGRKPLAEAPAASLTACSGHHKPGNRKRQ
jgi:hypothetical protein